MSLTGWNQSQMLYLTIPASAVGSNLTDFPVLVHLSTSSGTNDFDCSDVFAKLGTSSKKIAIEDRDTGNQCYCEIEFWDDSNNNAVLHVKAPSVSASNDTTLRLYYDETQADNTTYIGDTGDTAAQNVWDSNFACVCHLAQATGNLLDSTDNSNDIGGFSGTRGAEGIISGVTTTISVDSSHTGTIADNASLRFTGAMTLEGVISHSSFSGWKTVIEKGYDQAYAWKGNGELKSDINFSSDGRKTVSFGAHSSGWRVIATVFDGDHLISYNDGTANAQYDLPATDTVKTTSDNLSIGKDLSYVLSELRLSKVARSDTWIALTNVSLRDNLLQIGSNVIVRSVISQPYSLPPYIVKNFYSQPYDLTDVVRNYFIQLYGLKMVAFWVQRYGNAPVIRAVLDQYYGDAAQVLAVFEQPYRSAYQVRSTHKQPYSLPAPLVKIFEQRYSITADQVRAIYDQLYAIKNTDLARRYWVQPWLIVDGGLGVRSYSVTVTVDGQQVRVVHVNIEASRDQYAMSCELQLAGQADYMSCDIMSELLATIDSETFHFFVESKSRNRRHGQTTYTIQGLSPAARMDAPYSEPWSGDLSGMASDIADQVAGGIVTIDWQTVDWFIPADTLLAGDATPIQIIRQLAEAAGAVLQSQPDGTLVIEPLYPTPVPDWNSVTPDYTLSDALDFFSTNEDFDHRPGYNLYRISDQAESLDTVRIEEETISATEKIIRVYQAPWQDDFYLDNSGGAWVIIEPLGIEQKLVEDELVEFVGGEGHTQYPIYGASAMSWLQEPLGTVTMAEDGRLTASVGGESLLKISYHTKCRKYRAIDHQVEPVQIVAREAA